jgi:hypothetical protein
MSVTSTMHMFMHTRRGRGAFAANEHVRESRKLAIVSLVVADGEHRDRRRAVARHVQP